MSHIADRNKELAMITRRPEAAPAGIFARCSRANRSNRRWFDPQEETPSQMRRNGDLVLGAGRISPLANTIVSFCNSRPALRLEGIGTAFIQIARRAGEIGPEFDLSSFGDRVTYGFFYRNIFNTMRNERWSTNTAIRTYTNMSERKDDIPTVFDCLASTQLSPPEMAIRNEECGRVREVVGELPAFTQLVLEKTLIGRGQGDIASAEGAAKDSVRRHLVDGLWHVGNSLLGWQIPPFERTRQHKNRPAPIDVKALPCYTEKGDPDPEDVSITVEAAKDGWTVIYHAEEQAGESVVIRAPRSNRHSVKVRWYDGQREQSEHIKPKGRLHIRPTIRLRKVEVQSVKTGQAVRVKVEGAGEPVPVSPKPLRLFTAAEIRKTFTLTQHRWKKLVETLGLTPYAGDPCLRRDLYHYTEQDVRRLKRYLASLNPQNN